MITLLTIEEEIRRILILSGKELTREKQQRWEDREVLWDTKLEKSMHEANVVLALYLSGKFDNDDDLSSIDVNIQMQRYRTSAWLK